MSWITTPRQVLDPDVAAYITAVEAIDGQALETNVRLAINTFVVGCKADGIWNAIKASCILAGARTRTGTLVPLVGAAPTSFNFVDADYDRKTGLKGDASTKYLNSNRNNNADPQNSRHLSVYISTASTASQYGGEIGYYGGSDLGNSYLGRYGNEGQWGLSSNLSRALSVTGITGFKGADRRTSSSFSFRQSGSTYTTSVPSLPPVNNNILVFSAGPGLLNNARLSFYSIGESIDLALLDARVATLMSDLAAAIP